MASLPDVQTDDVAIDRGELNALAGDANGNWSYERAFQRNRGLISTAEQARLRHCRVAIAGLGGVGGVHLMTLARTGVGKFNLADPDVFDVINFNRQCGATLKNVGCNKAAAMAEAALDVNPELELRVFPVAINEHNVDAFLKDCDLFLDGLDFFAVDARRLVFRRAAELGIWGITAGPIGFGTAWLAFDPNGMSFDRYFDFHDRMARLDKLIAFAVGLAPRALHISYLDLTEVSIDNEYGPSAALACQLASGIITAESLHILLRRGGSSAAPNYHQFDAYRSRLIKGRLAFGNRSLLQRVKRYILKQRLRLPRYQHPA